MSGFNWSERHHLKEEADWSTANVEAGLSSDADVGWAAERRSTFDRLSVIRNAAQTNDMENNPHRSQPAARPETSS